MVATARAFPWPELALVKFDFAKAIKLFLEFDVLSRKKK
jgi:hypothetical protein